MIVELSEEEKEGIVQFLFLFEKARKKKLNDEYYILLLLWDMNSYKNETNKIDAYVACRACYHKNERVYTSADKKILESLLPECNRLSGNVHDEEEKARNEGKRLEAEKKKLFSN